jgi:transposase
MIIDRKKLEERRKALEEKRRAEAEAATQEGGLQRRASNMHCVSKDTSTVPKKKATPEGESIF